MIRPELNLALDGGAWRYERVGFEEEVLAEVPVYLVIRGVLAQKPGFDAAREQVPFGHHLRKCLIKSCSILTVSLTTSLAKVDYTNSTITSQPSID